MELIFDKERGNGKCTTEKGDEFFVLQVEGLYNLSITPKNRFSYWAKENVKRLSTIQKYLDNRGYDIQIKEV